MDGYESDELVKEPKHIFEDSRGTITAAGALRYPSRDTFAI